MIIESDELLQKNINEYVATNKPVLCILTPCYDAKCHMKYTISLINTLTLLKQSNIQVYMEFCCGDSLISRARNNLVAKAMCNRSVTHIIFIDSDIGWDPLDIVKLLLNNESLVGGVYPLKRYRWEKITNNPEIIKTWISKKDEYPILKDYSDEDIIKNKLLNYNFNYATANTSISNNLAEIRHLGTGFMMIKRETIEQMMLSLPYTKYVDDTKYLTPEENEFAYTLFDCAIEDGHYLSEDWLFCQRWRNMGGKVFMNVSINLTHTGTEEFKGSFFTSIL